MSTDRGLLINLAKHHRRMSVNGKSEHLKKVSSKYAQFTKIQPGGKKNSVINFSVTPDFPPKSQGGKQRLATAIISRDRLRCPELSVEIPRTLFGHSCCGRPCIPSPDRPIGARLNKCIPGSRSLRSLDLSIGRRPDPKLPAYDVLRRKTSNW